jgi:GTP cyclohydrolase I
METKPYLQLVEPAEIDQPALLTSDISPLVRQLLISIGENPEREGLLRTPERVSRMFGELVSGYQIDIAELVNGAIFESDYKGPVTVRDIDFYSMCEHHLLPFYGKVHVSYVPDGKIIGLSKIPRLVDMYARRLQIQERLTQQVAEQLDSILKPKGAMVVVESVHLCTMMRGVKKDQVNMVTQTALGVYQSDAKLSHDFLTLIRR